MVPRGKKYDSTNYSDGHAIAGKINVVSKNSGYIFTNFNWNYMSVFDQRLLDFLEPLAKLSASRKQELADVCFIEKVGKGINPLRMNVSKAPQLIYLIKGELRLHFHNDQKLILRGGSPAAKHPINDGHEIKQMIALTEVEILRADTDLLDIMLMWDQLFLASTKRDFARNSMVCAAI